MFKSKSIRIIAASVVTSALVGSAIGDMVYDDENTMSAAPTSKVEVRSAIASTEVVSTQPVIVETQKIQKQSEKSRERRGFQESVNNELVIQKLEEKRLKEEEKLTAAINKKFTLEDEAPAGTDAPVIKKEIIVKPISEAPASYEMSPAPKVEAVIVKPVGSDQIASYQSSVNTSIAPVIVAEKIADQRNTVGFITRGGFSTISSPYYDFTNRYTLGFGLAFNASDNVGIELGYTYSDYLVGMNQPTNYPGYIYNPMTFKNNTFDATLKLYLTDRETTFRPFLGAGIGYSVGYVNYNQESMGAYGYQWGSEDYQLNQILGALQAGADIKISRNFYVGMSYKYYKPLSSTESQEGFYNGGFYSPYSNGTYIDPAKQQVRGSLRNSASQTYLITATLSF